MKAFAGKNALVTGGASGIGRALAEALLAAGAHVTIADIAGAAECGRTLGCAAAALDVRDSHAFAGVVRGIAESRGRLDYLFNNAGVATVGEARCMSDEDWRRVLDVNVYGVVHGVQAAYPIMIRQGSGHIVNTASAAGLMPIPGAVAYAASKHAVVGLSLSLRAEARRHGVKVSVLCPSFVRTPIARNVKLLGGIDRAQALRVVDRIGWMEPQDLARRALRAVARDEAVMVAPASVRVLISAARRSALVREAFERTAAALIARLG